MILSQGQKWKNKTKGQDPNVNPPSLSFWPQQISLCCHLPKALRLPPETVLALSGPLKPASHNSQCWRISIPWDTGLLIPCGHILCIFQRAHGAQELMLWREGLWLWRPWLGCGAAPGAVLAQLQEVPVLRSAHTRAGTRELCLLFPSGHSLTQQMHS